MRGRTGGALADGQCADVGAESMFEIRCSDAVSSSLALLAKCVSRRQSVSFLARKNSRNAVDLERGDWCYNNNITPTMSSLLSAPLPACLPGCWSGVYASLFTANTCPLPVRFHSIAPFIRLTFPPLLTAFLDTVLNTAFLCCPRARAEHQSAVPVSARVTPADDSIACSHRRGQACPAAS